MVTFALMSVLVGSVLWARVGFDNFMTGYVLAYFEHVLLFLAYSLASCASATSGTHVMKKSLCAEPSEIFLGVPGAVVIQCA
jgi:hypothetical protein